MSSACCLLLAACSLWPLTFKEGPQAIDQPLMFEPSRPYNNWSQVHPVSPGNPLSLPIWIATYSSSNNTRSNGPGIMRVGSVYIATSIVASIPCPRDWSQVHRYLPADLNKDIRFTIDQGSVLAVRVFGSLSIYFTPQPEVVPGVVIIKAHTPGAIYPI